MITIERRGTGFKMKFSNPGTGTRGFSVYPRGIPQIVTCLHHYYIMKHDEDDCPLCELARKERKK